MEERNPAMASKSRPLRRPAVQHATAADLVLEAPSMRVQSGSGQGRPHTSVGGVGAKLVDLDEDAVGDGKACVEPNPDGTAVGAGQDNAVARVRPGADQDTVAADAGHVAEKTSKY